jgi:tetratricopeptide (TPR) repeat protein
LKQEYNLAIDYYQKAIELNQKADLDNHKIMAVIYKDLGLVFSAKLDFSEALNAFLESFRIKKTQANREPRELYDILLLIAESEFKLLAYEDARESFRCCLGMINEAKKGVYKDSEVFNLHKKIGLCSRKLNNLDLAIEHFKIAEVLPQSSEICSGEIASVKYNLASALLSLGMNQEALTTFKQAVEKYKTEKKPNEIEMSRCYFYIGICNFKVTRIFNF